MPFQLLFDENFSGLCMSSCHTRLMQVVKYLIDEGFYVNIDFHSIGMAGEGLGIKADDNTLYNTTLWVGLWYVLCLEQST